MNTKVQISRLEDYLIYQDRIFEWIGKAQDMRKRNIEQELYESITTINDTINALYENITSHYLNHGFSDYILKKLTDNYR
jgi:hypothetical protein